jgi:hypothetical protein
MDVHLPSSYSDAGTEGPFEASVPKYLVSHYALYHEALNYAKNGNNLKRV